MNGQDGSIDGLGSCTAKRNSVKDVRDIARKIFKDEFSWFDYDDPLFVEGVFSQVRVFYVCTKTSVCDQRTFLDCRFHFDSRQMWIGSIEVAAHRRLHGIGRQLVRVAEATGNALGMEEVRILPLSSSVEFWLKLGYSPNPRMARVLRKNLADVEESQKSYRANSLCTSSSSAETI